MASLQSGGNGRSGRKALDQEVPLVPFIDLLLCCVMFLLATAVWNQVSRMPGRTSQDSVDGTVQEPSDTPTRRLLLDVRTSGYVLGSTDGEHLDIPKVGDRYDVSSLAARLHDAHALDPNRRDLVIRPEDGVVYADIVAAMDVAAANELTDLEVSAIPGQP